MRRSKVGFRAESGRVFKVSGFSVNGANLARWMLDFRDSTRRGERQLDTSVVVYGDQRSGNCRKVVWALEKAGVAYDWREVDIMAGDTRDPDFLRLNQNGKVPTVCLADGRVLCESNAILWYFCETTDWIPEDAFERARVLQWMFFEQYSHEPYIAVRRFIRQYLDWPNERYDDYVAREAGGHAALNVMANVLRESAFIAGDQMTVADVALYAYTSVAHEGGFDLKDYPLIQSWLARCEQNLPQGG